jgi:hypothetical protein
MTEALLIEQAATVCPVDDYEAVEVVTQFLSERERMEEFEAGLSQSVAEALTTAPHSETYLRELRARREDARAQSRAAMKLAIKIALGGWRPASDRPN